MKYVWALLFPFVLAALPAFCQQIAATSPTLVPVPASRLLPGLPVPSCARANTAVPGLHNWFCYETGRVLSTSAMIWAFTGASYMELHPQRRGYDADAVPFERHLEYYYSRRTAASFGEMLGGYLNHEPIEHAASGKATLWGRAHYAIMSVLTVPESGGGSRIAISPITGSLASGFITMECCTWRQTPAMALRRSGFTYAGYFGTALLREFKPDLTSFLRRKFRRDDTN